MVKKILLSLTALIIVAVGLGLVFKEPLKEVVYQQVTKNMFVTTDDDDFEPGNDGTQIGQQLPAVRVSYEGSELSSLARFTGQQGLVVMFSRSVVW